MRELRTGRAEASAGTPPKAPAGLPAPTLASPDEGLEAVPIASFRLDASGRVTDANTPGMHMLGKSRDAVVGSDFLRLLRPADVALAGRELARILEGERRAHEFDITLPEGPIVRAKLTGVPIFEAGAVVGARAFAEVVDGRSEAWFRELTDAAPVLIWLSAPDGACTYFNAGWLTFTGQSLEESLGDGWAEAIHPDDIDGYVAIYLDHLARREPYAIEYRLRRATGDFVWVLEHASPRFDKDREFRGFVGSAVPITHQKELERELDARVAERTSRLSRALRDLETFTSSASHDLRAPLRGVDTLLEALQEDHGAGLPEGAAALVARARQENRRASSLVKDLLAFTQSGHEALDPVLVDVSALCERVVEQIDQDHPAWMTTWEIGKIPNVVADEGLLHIALQNLLENAGKYSSRSSHPLVKIFGAIEDGRWSLSVEDNGIGFAPGQEKTLFAPFHRLANATTFAGTGLGLAAVDRVAHRHGGTVRAEGRPGAGATFTLELPTTPTPRTR